MRLASVFRPVLATALVCAAATVLLAGSLRTLAVLVAAGFLAHWRTAGNWRRAALFAWPILTFAAILPLLQWAGGRPVDWALPLRSTAIFFWLTSAVRIFPWTPVLRRARPGSPLFEAVLFLFILRHFVAILGTEARRAMIARRMAVPREYGPEWFSSLRGAVTGVFRRAIVRAERFYAAQILREAAE